MPANQEDLDAGGGSIRRFRLEYTPSSHRADSATWPSAFRKLLADYNSERVARFHGEHRYTPKWCYGISQCASLGAARKVDVDLQRKSRDRPQRPASPHFWVSRTSRHRRTAPRAAHRDQAAPCEPLEAQSCAAVKSPPSAGIHPGADSYRNLRHRGFGRRRAGSKGPGKQLSRCLDFDESERGVGSLSWGPDQNQQVLGGTCEAEEAYLQGKGRIDNEQCRRLLFAARMSRNAEGSGAPQLLELSNSWRDCMRRLARHASRDAVDQADFKR